MDKVYTGFIVFTTLLAVGYALECYTCERQDSNRDKCIKTTKQCEQFQDACTSYIQWGVPPYWTPRGDRIYFISKSCDTRQGCERRKAATQSACKRDWYNDWACVECCTGDLCNYYVTLGAGTVKANVVTLLVGLSGLYLLRKLI